MWFFVHRSSFIEVWALGVVFVFYIANHKSLNALHLQGRLCLWPCASLAIVNLRSTDFLIPCLIFIILI
jgi:hypothetical protein